ncbi:acyl-CoA dehydrogenase [Halobacillus andaensis]|uniref:Acyl-CoA dehydrogenase n=1 Tax=Halobacillus andaensis TaxID=1176239 RepID=A0A917B9A4_HALAA|nr:acyl-CoA dehydrogenase family protein [Halobacillus andaensis]MBP2005459.1 alkylation response protein AidB-like acyl-CoA dehydrogenase [Halobacillus andaensis]GGF31650.1 acyl-CoA dehydrogenase [Halobacillus andaensis]
MNFYKQDEDLQAILREQLDSPMFTWADKQLQEFGRMCGEEIDQRAVHTDREGQPRLIKYNKMGEDISEVWVNEGYRKTVEETYREGIVGYVHKTIPELNRKGNYLYSFAQGYLLSQVEPGFYCPVTLTMATAYLIDHYANEEIKESYLPHVTATGDVELHEGATFLTERQGGSDVGANEVKAIEENGAYRIYGEKYFASNAGMCGVAMVLARIEGAQPGTKGLSLFLVPWRTEDGELNRVSIRRLKDKLGVRAVPSAEVEFEGAMAFLIGEAERGFYYMMEALNLSRVCNAVASIGIMRRAYTETKSYALEREAFGHSLIHYPMVQDTLVRMRVKQEVETSAVFKMIETFDRVARTPVEVSKKDQVLSRLLIAILKKETADQSIHFAHESIEMHGGNGFIEDFVTPRLLRDAQVLTVWEGTSNILGLEVIRLLTKYNGHTLFWEQLESDLEKINILPEEKQIVQKSLDDTKAFIDKVLTLSHEKQTYYSKTIAKKLADLYEGVHALARASENERKRKVAEVFVAITFSNETRIDDPATLKYVEDVLGISLPESAKS